MLGRAPVAALLVVSFFSSTSAQANWTAKLEQTIQQSQANAAAFKRQGFVPVYAKIYVKNNVLLMDEIWERGAIPWDSRARLTDAQYAAHDARMRREGYANYCHSACRLNGVTYHAGVWRKGRLGPIRAIRLAEDRETHKRSVGQLAQQGFIPVYVKGSANGNSIRMDQVWEKRAGRWDMRSFLDAKQFALHDKQMRGQGYRRVWHSRYSVNRTVMNAGIWHR